jgi:transglutaminase-like putative cysteine protease
VNAIFRLACLSACFLTPLLALDAARGDNGPRLDREVKQKWQIGIIVIANAPSGGVYGTASAPIDWPEQKVEVVAEELSPHVGEFAYRELGDGLKQMQISIPRLAAGDKAEALVTFEITRRILLPPENPLETYVVPKRTPRDVAIHLGESPLIESRRPQIKEQLKEIVAGRDSAWEQVEAIYDWVRDNIEYTGNGLKGQGEVKGALATLRDKSGMNEDLSSLFIALCRAHRVPARTVWVEDHNYPEFYLHDREGKGYWFPCQVAGEREFGGISETRPILQKGENFKVPEMKKPQRFVGEYLAIKSAGGVRPQHEFVRRLVHDE